MLVGDQSTFAAPKGTAPKPKGLGASLTGLGGTPSGGGGRSATMGPPSYAPSTTGPTMGPPSYRPPSTTGSVGPVPTTSTGGSGVTPVPLGMISQWYANAPDPAQMYAGLAQQAAMQEGWYNWQNQYANQSTGLNQQSLGLNLAGNQIEQNTNTAEGSIIDRLKGLAGQDYHNTLAGFGIDRTEAGQRRDRDKWDEENRATAGGVTLFPAHGRNMGDIESAYTNTAGRIGLGEKGAGITHQQTLLGLDRQKLQNSTQAQKLDLMAQQYGIDAQQLQLGLQNTIANLGYQEGQAMLQLQDLYDQLGSPDGPTFTNAASTLEMLLAMYFGGGR